MKGLGTPLVVNARPILGARYGPHWAHARPGGGPVLREDTCWRTISGVILNTPWFAVWLYFRRWA